MASQNKTATRLPVKKHPDPLALKLFRLLFKVGEIIAAAATGWLAYNVWLNAGLIIIYPDFPLTRLSL